MSTRFSVSVEPLKRGFMKSYRAGRIQDKSTFGKWNENNVLAGRGELYETMVWSDEFTTVFGGSFQEPEGFETYWLNQKLRIYVMNKEEPDEYLEKEEYVLCCPGNYSESYGDPSKSCTGL